jgi:hypothetical protein
MDCIALASSASVGAVGVKPSRGNEISAADAHAPGERARQRSDGIVPHELRKERQFGFILGRAYAKTVLPFRPRLAPQSSHDRQSLDPERFAGTPNRAIVGLGNA